MIPSASVVLIFFCQQQNSHTIDGLLGTNRLPFFCFPILVQAFFTNNYNNTPYGRLALPSFLDFEGTTDSSGNGSALKDTDISTTIYSTVFLCDLSDVMLVLSTAGGSS